MLSISRMADGQEDYYLDLAREDYYLAGGEPPGIWLGRGAGALGLQGQVTRSAFSSLLHGEGPDGRSLGQIQHYQDGRARQPGWDLTFSAPKSVSALWAVSSTEVRAAIQDAQLQAVQAALAYLEDHAAFTRRGRGGERTEQVRLIFAAFEHGTSRAQDPQLHTHVLVPNAGLRSDGSWGAIRSLDLYENKMAAGALYRAELAHALQSILGLTLRSGPTAFSVRGVPQLLADAFSTRRALIEALARERGLATPRAFELLALSTRTVKEHVAREELFSEWRKTAAGYGFTQQHAALLITPLREYRPRPALLRDAVRKSLDSIVERDGYFAEKDLVQKTADLLQAHAIPAQAIRTAVSEALRNSTDLVQLVGNQRRPLFTTRAFYELEENLLHDAAKAARTRTHPVSPAKVDRLLRSPACILSDEQKVALRQVTADDAGLQCIVGMPGTGKTRLLAEARALWKEAGLVVRGCALAARAARELERGSGIPSLTIARLLMLIENDPLPRRAVLVVDEAGMIGARQMHRLLRVAQSAGARIVLVGDDRQLQPIEAGGPFAGLVKRFGAAHLSDIQRQHEEWMRDAVRQFADGDARGALSQYALAGRLHVADTRRRAMDELVASWKDRKTADLSQTLILTGLRSEAEDLNRLAQASRLSTGDLSARDAIHLRDCSYYVGDRVMFTKNDYPRGILNGSFGTIEIIHARPLRPPEFLVRLDTEEYTTRRVVVQLTEKTPLQLGYAVTTHKAQGATVDRAFVLAGGTLADRELAYVQVSRAREETRLFLSDADAGEDLSVLARTLQRSNKKHLVHDIEQSQGLSLGQ